MKTLLLLFVWCTAISVYTYAQVDQEDQEDKPRTPAEAQFEKAAAFYEDGDLASAAAEFRKFMVEFPQSPLVARAHYNVGYINFVMGDYETAKLIFNEVLTKPYNELDSNNLMEPYTLYKHHTCRLLAEIALKQQDYAAAEKYIHQFDKVYPYQHFCGNEWAAYDNYLAVMKAEVYAGKGQVKKALEELLPHIFNNGLASNKEVINQTISLLEKNYSCEALREEFKRAQASLTVKSTRKRTNATVTLYGVTVPVEGIYFYDENMDKMSELEQYQYVVKENEVFKKFL